MKLRVRSERFLVGLRGLALLRGWPFAPSEEADEHLEAIRAIMSEPGAEPVIEIDDPGLDEAYEQWSSAYDAIANALIDTEQPALRSLLVDNPPGLALDAGAGTGRVSTLLVELGHRVVALDGSTPMLAQARRKGIERIVLGDLRQLPVADASVDIATCALALTHVNDLAGAIAELGRVVKPGGHVVLSDIHPFAVATGAHAFFRREDGSRSVARNHVHWPSTYVDAASAAGLVVGAMAEPTIDARFAADVDDAGMRLAIQASLIGFPLVLAWRLQKR